MWSIATRLYGGDGVVSSGSDLGGVSELLEDKDAVVWIGLEDPAADELAVLAGELGLHRLAVEDALEAHQRDKYVHYDDHLFLVCHEVALDVARADLDTREIDAFIGDRWLITVHRGAGEVLDRAVDRWDRSREIAACGVGFLVYGLLDVVLDGYFDVVEAFEAYYDEKADHVFADDPIAPEETRQWFEMRRTLNRFKRIVGPLSQALETMADRDRARFPEPAGPYLRDIAGEIARVAGEVDGLRELVAQIVDVNLTLRDYRQNLVM